MKNKKLTEICSPKQWKTIAQTEMLDSGYPVYGANGIIGYYDKYNHENPTVLITCRGATCGSLNISKPYSYINGNAMALDNVIDEVDGKYLCYFLKDRGFKDVISGSAQPQITIQNLMKVIVSYPNIEQQRKIVSMLDKADEIRTKKRLANDKLDEFLKSTFIDMFGDPETNNKNWKKGTIRDLIEEAKYGTSGKAGTTGAYPILRMGNLTYKGAITYDDLKYIDLKNEEISKYTLQNGDILFNRTNSKELVGKTAVYKSDKQMAFAGYLVRVRTNKKAVPDFISSYMNSDYMKSILRAKCKNIVGMANINAQEFQDFEIYIPPIELQNKFAQIVEKVEEQKQKNEQVIEQMDNLFNSLSQKAFKGELC